MDKLNALVNPNICKSLTVAVNGTSTPLLSQLCSEVIIRNIGANDVLVYQLKEDRSGYETDYFTLKASTEFTFRGLVFASDLAVKSTSGSTITYRTQYYSLLTR